MIGVNAGWKYAPAAGWIAGAAVYLIWTWMVAGRMSPEQTAAHAARVDITGLMTDVIVVSASVVSLAGVGYLLRAASAERGAIYGAAVGVGSVVVSWVAIHTVFTLRYAQLYYSGTPGGIDFNDPEPPAYVDFAYLAFTIGMAFQVSDPNLQTPKIRATALRHALIVLSARGGDRGHDDQLDHRTEPAHQLRVASISSRTIAPTLTAS
jgi:uncharacterized membrane protein